MTEARNYYESNKEVFTLNLEWDNPAPWQLLFNKETNAYWTPKTCADKWIDFDLFKAGELEARSETQSE